MTSTSRIAKAASAAFWLVLWQVLSLIIGEELFLPSPIAVIGALSGMLLLPSFWKAIIFTLARIMAGFLLSLSAGIILAALSYRASAMRLLLDPAVRIIRATPVASVVILILVWISSRNLSVIISFLMVFPIIYTSVLKGMDETDPGLIEMGRAYRIGTVKRFRYIYLPCVLPYLSSGVSIALGLAWKSGIAAEVIGLPSGSIGERVYEAKIYLATPDLFAWTAVIILLAFLFEKFFLFMLRSVSWRLR